MNGFGGYSYPEEKQGPGSRTVDPATATITVSRTSPRDVRMRQIYISIDGRTAAELLFGQSFTTTIPAGPHRLRANNTLVWKTLDCELKPGEHVHFPVVNRPGFGSWAMLSLLGGGPLYLTFERADPPAAQPPPVSDG